MSTVNVMYSMYVTATAEGLDQLERRVGTGNLVDYTWRTTVPLVIRHQSPTLVSVRIQISQWTLAISK